VVDPHRPPAERERDVGLLGGPFELQIGYTCVTILLSGEELRGGAEEL